jgi:hypothetical protein
MFGAIRAGTICLGGAIGSTVGLVLLLHGLNPDIRKDISAYWVAGMIVGASSAIALLTAMLLSAMDRRERKALLPSIALVFVWALIWSFYSQYGSTLAALLGF